VLKSYKNHAKKEKNALNFFGLQKGSLNNPSLL
jgi:hypothetical protein